MNFAEQLENVTAALPADVKRKILITVASHNVIAIYQRDAGRETVYEFFDGSRLVMPTQGS